MVTISSGSERSGAIERIETFRSHVRSYLDLLDESAGAISFRVEHNHARVEDERKQLVAEYAALEKIIKEYGNKPRMSDGTWNVVYSPYANGFSADTLARVRPSLNAVVDDLNVVLGRLSAISDEEFVSARKAREEPRSQNPSSATLWHYSNPLWLGWRLLLWMWHHKLISGIATAIAAPLAVAFIVHWLHWN